MMKKIIRWKEQPNQYFYYFVKRIMDIGTHEDVYFCAVEDATIFTEQHSLDSVCEKILRIAKYHQHECTLEVVDLESQNDFITNYNRAMKGVS